MLKEDILSVVNEFSRSYWGKSFIKEIICLVGERFFEIVGRVVDCVGKCSIVVGK